MSSNRFISEGRNAWQRLEDLLKMLDRSSLRRLNREEVRELGRIYRRTASDLAIARAESRDPRLVNYLNSLVIRAHGRIYRANALEGGGRIRRFFVRDFPGAFRRTWRFTFLAFAVFMLFFAFAFVATRMDPAFSEFGGVSPLAREDILHNRPRWWEQLNEYNEIGASFILTNNILVTFRAFAFGAMLGVGTLYEMAAFGVHVGSLLSLTFLAGYGTDLLTFMSAHGVIELSCVFIAGGAGMLFGTAVLIPGDLSRADALKLRGADAIRLVVGCVPLLVIAGIIEGYISPAIISPGIKFAIAALTFVALYTYLILSGREI